MQKGRDGGSCIVPRRHIDVQNDFPLIPATTEAWDAMYSWYSPLQALSCIASRSRKHPSCEAAGSSCLGLENPQSSWLSLKLFSEDGNKPILYTCKETAVGRDLISI